MSLQGHVDRAKLGAIHHEVEGLAEPALKCLVEGGAKYAQDQARANAPRSTGALASSISASVHGMSAKVSSTLSYARPVESGRRAGARMPPSSAFSRFGSAAFVIARAVAKRGVRGRFFMARASKSLMDHEFPRLIAQEIKRIEAQWSRL